MKQASLKFKMYAGSASIINNDVERLALHFILWSFGALALFYVLLLGNMVFNIVERRSLEISARSLEGEVRNLELAYLSASNNVDLVLSQSLGFREAKANFATRKSLGYRPTLGRSPMGEPGEAFGSLGRSPMGESLGSVKMFQNDI